MPAGTLLSSGARRCACALVLLAGAAAGAARAAEIPATPPAQPTRVAASFFFNTIENVDSANELFNADFYLVLRWDDPRLAELPPEQIDSGALWEPRIEVVNSRDLGEAWDPFFEFPGPGKVKNVNRLNGTFAAPMDLRDFPFDHQVLPIQIESSAFEVGQMVFSHPPGRHERRGWSTQLKPDEVLGNGVRLPEWTIEAVRVRELDSYYKPLETRFSRYRIEILVARRPGFYVWNVILIEAMIVVLSWVVFLMDAGEVGNRSALAVTLLLATVAFSYVVSGLTPRTPYLTLLDKFLLGCFFLISLSNLETVAVYLLQRRGTDAAMATRVDRWSLVAFPVLFLMHNLLLWGPVLT